MTFPMAGSPFGRAGSRCSLCLLSSAYPIAILRISRPNTCRKPTSSSQAIQPCTTFLLTSLAGQGIVGMAIILVFVVLGIRVLARGLLSYGGDGYCRMVLLIGILASIAFSRPFLLGDPLH